MGSRRKPTRKVRWIWNPIGPKLGMLTIATPRLELRSPCKVQNEELAPAVPQNTSKGRGPAGVVRKTSRQLSTRSPGDLASSLMQGLESEWDGIGTIQ